jgi:phosphopantothenoylcysteine decarboxylase/phosphopantothenate--cysteine ligase
VSGGIAAYKVCELASQFTQRGVGVRAVMTASAARFVGPLTMAALTGHDVAVGMFEQARKASNSHIELARWGQAVILAPATANIIAKAAHGLADDLLSTILLVSSAPLLVAPAMNPQMFAHPAVSENLACLRGRGVRVVGPASGRTACGEDGPGRMAEPDEIMEALWELLTPKDLAGVRLVVSAGPTREHLDPVRFLSNPSSGRMGIEVARMAYRRGAQVTLVLGPTQLLPPGGVRVVRVTSAQEMFDAVVAATVEAQVVVKAAAVSDFRPTEVYAHKVKKSPGQAQSCELLPTVDILAALGRDKGGRVLVGFAAETRDLLANATAKLKAKNLDLIVANDVSSADAGFVAPTNRVTILDPSGGVEELTLMSKAEVANRLLGRVSRLLGRA